MAIAVGITAFIAAELKESLTEDTVVCPAGCVGSLCSLCNIIPSTTNSRGSSLLYQIALILRVTGSDAATPADGCKGNCTCHNRLIEKCAASWCTTHGMT